MLEGKNVNLRIEEKEDMQLVAIDRNRLHFGEENLLWSTYGRMQRAMNAL